MPISYSLNLCRWFSPTPIFCRTSRSLCHVRGLKHGWRQERVLLVIRVNLRELLVRRDPSDIPFTVSECFVVTLVRLALL